MGYCMEMSEENFLIRKENAPLVFKALKEFAETRTNNYLMWVHLPNLIGAESIEEAFDEIRYPLCVNKDGDYEIDYFSGEKLGDDSEIFNSFAKYIEDDRYIEMTGEDGSQWRWFFKNGICHEVHPDVIWKMP